MSCSKSYMTANPIVTLDDVKEYFNRLTSAFHSPSLKATKIAKTFDYSMGDISHSRKSFVDFQADTLYGTITHLRFTIRSSEAHLTFNNADNLFGEVMVIQLYCDDMATLGKYDAVISDKLTSDTVEPYVDGQPPLPPRGGTNNYYGDVITQENNIEINDSAISDSQITANIQNTPLPEKESFWRKPFQSLASKIIIAVFVLIVFLLVGFVIGWDILLDIIRSS